MGDQLAGANNLARVPQLGMIGQSGCRIAENLVHARRGVKVVGGDVQPDVITVLFRFGLLFSQDC